MGAAIPVRVQLRESRMFRDAELSFHLEQIGDDVRILHRLDPHLRNALLYPLLRLTSRRALSSGLDALRARLAEAPSADKRTA